MKLSSNPVRHSYHYIRNQGFVRSMVLVFGTTGYHLSWFAWMPRLPNSHSPPPEAPFAPFGARSLKPHTLHLASTSSLPRGLGVPHPRAWSGSAASGIASLPSPVVVSQAGAFGRAERRPPIPGVEAERERATRHAEKRGGKAGRWFCAWMEHVTHEPSLQFMIHVGVGSLSKHSMGLPYPYPWSVWAIKHMF